MSRYCVVGDVYDEPTRRYATGTCCLVKYLLKHESRNLFVINKKMALVGSLRKLKFIERGPFLKMTVHECAMVGCWLSRPV